MNIPRNFLNLAVETGFLARDFPSREHRDVAVAKPRLRWLCLARSVDVGTSMQRFPETGQFWTYL